MASPSPVTMPELQATEATLYVVRKGEDTIIGQAASINPQSQVPTRKIARLGDTNKKTTYQPAEHSVQLELYSELNVEQLAEILGGTTRPVSGWTGTEELRLNPTIQPYMLYIDVYDGASGLLGNDKLVGTWHLYNFKPTTLNMPVGADQVVTYTVNGECDDIYYVPEAESL